jgi:hypothetical protein
MRNGKCRLSDLRKCTSKWQDEIAELSALLVNPPAADQVGGT